MRKNLPVTGKEVLFKDDDRIISITNTKGVLTSINEAFLKISGFTEEELIGQAHNLVRHPDMPQAAFADLWATLAQKKPCLGLVKNRCKNGDHYWVNAYVMGVYKNGTLTGYQSVRTKPERKHVEAAEILYAKLQNGKSPTGLFGYQTRQLLPGLIMTAIPASVLLLLGSSTWFGISAAATTAVIAAFALRKWQQKPIHALQQRAQLIHSSDIACLAYCGDTSPASQVEIAILAIQSQQATLIELLRNSVQDLMFVINDTNAIVQKSNQGVNQQSLEIS